MGCTSKMTRMLLTFIMHTTLISGELHVIADSSEVYNEDNNKATPTTSNCTLTETCVDCSCLGLYNTPDNLHKNITCLNLRGNKIQLLNGTILRRYPLLAKLSLSNNSITQIQEDDFKNLSSLTMLDLSLNNIQYTDIDTKAFTDLSSLNYLDLKQAIDQNPHTTYPESLTELNQLDKLMIDGISSPVPYLPNLRELYLSGQYGRCSIPLITFYLFHKIYNVQALYLSNCSVKNVDSRAFYTLQNLDSLDLSWNMDLTFAALPSITIGLPKNFKRLNMNNVYRYYLDDECTSLTFANMQYIFQHTSIEVLTLEGNKVVHVDNNVMLTIPQTLRYLSMRDNMQMISSSTLLAIQYQLLRHLVYYDISKMFSSHLPPDIKYGFVQLSPKVNTTADFAHTQLPKEANVNFETNAETRSKCVDCRTMFTRNEIKTYFEILDDRLKEFNITPVGENKDMTSADHYAIEYLDLSECYSDSYKLIFQLFNKPETVKFLNMSSSYLGYALIDNSTFFDRFVALTTLDIGSNGILALKEHIFDNVNHLERLYIGNNKLTNITFNINLLKNLIYLDLHSNHLEVLDKKVMDDLDMLPNITINMVDNTLLCSCNQRNLNFLQWLFLNRDNFQNYDEMQCFMEKNATRIKMSEFNVEQFKIECQPPKFEILTLVTSLCIITFLFVVFGGLVYRHRWNLRYLYYMTKFKLTGGYRQIDHGDYDRDIFLSYAEEDRIFVREHVLSHLEDTGDFSLLVHGRDFQAGELVADNIVRAVTSTRRTLVILTKAYTQSKWCMYELNIARMEGINANRNVLCVVMKEDIAVRSLPIEVIDIIRSRTYIDYPSNPEDQNDFWERLKITLR